jgi:UPF0755 protein
MNKQKRFAFYILLPFAFLVFIYVFFLSAPANFPVGTVFKIEKGMGLRNLSLKLAQEHIIRSRLAFEAIVILQGAELRIKYSDFLFENKLPVYEVARRILSSENNIVTIPVTIPEGYDVGQIADTFATKLVNFDKSKFLLSATPREGHLFPDTYFFLASADEKDVLAFMNDNYDKKIKLLRSDIVKSGKSENDIIVMASLIEREAKNESDRGYISGILWKRLGDGMLLQVDAAPETYKMNGLPGSPIGNPGLAAIKSAIFPIDSPYLYYLHDKNGDIHYARTFGEHINNKFKYLQ